MIDSNYVVLGAWAGSAVLNWALRTQKAEAFVAWACTKKYGALIVAALRGMGADPVVVTEHAEQLMYDALQKAAKK